MSGKFWDEGPMLVTGCRKVSPGCDNCWSERTHVMRSKGPNAHIWPPECLTNGRFNGTVRFNLAALKRAVRGKKPKVIAPWNDLYHEGVTDEQAEDALYEMQGASQHTFLIITKRIERAAPTWKSPVPDNIWHIATMENQAMVDERMPHLLNIPGRRGIIIEPMLGPVNLMKCQAPENHCKGAENCDTPLRCDFHPLDNIHQVILGGETGTGARPMHPDWARSVRDQCAAAGVPFFFKAWGEWKHVIHQTRASYVVEANEPDMYIHCPMRDMDKEKYRRYETMGNDAFIRVGNKKAGRKIDGIEHNDLAWRTDGHL